ncbi:MAG: DNA polymerase III subunit delta [Deltaproteobacteria bacterium]|nr:DNA polymerase III subunit delta [Deltaproteobacteria bacterium]
MITLSELDQQLRRGDIAPLYLVVGAEAYLRRTAVQRIAQALAKAAGSVVTPQRFDASALTATELVARAQSDDLFAARQLLVVQGGEVWKSEAWEALATWRQHPSPVAVLIVQAEKLDQRGAAVKRLMASACVIECKSLYPNQVPDWVRIECQRRGKPISQDAARLLADVVGTELGALDQALEKLFLYCGDKQLIEATSVEAVILETSQRTVFEFAAAVGAGEPTAACHLLERLLSGGESPVMLLSMLARHWRLLVRARAWQEQGGKDKAPLAQTLKVHPFFVQEYARQAAQRPLPALARGLRQIAATDRALKRTRTPGRSVLTHCVLALSGKESPAL